MISKKMLGNNTDLELQTKLCKGWSENTIVHCSKMSFRNGKRKKYSN